jgi:hypothetical protein
MKSIKYDKTTKDFSMFLNGRYVGSRDTYRAAELELDRLTFETLARAA